LNYADKYGKYILNISSTKATAPKQTKKIYIRIGGEVVS